MLASSKGGFATATVRVQARAPHAVLNATAVRDWFANAGVGWPNDLLNVQPEHYLALSGPGVRQPGDVVEVIERWGPGPVTSFHAVPEPKLSFMPALDEFPVESQVPLALVLSDGTVFSHTLTGFRDLPGGNGVDIYEGAWVPDSTPHEIVKGLQAHNTVEFSNWMRFTYKKALATL